MTIATDSYVGFVGVTTGSSSMMRIFPRWAALLDLPTRTLVGHDLPLGAPPDAYRRVISLIKNDPHHWGALVTTHKVAIFESAGDLFDDMDELAQTFGEISSVAKRGPRLVGSAKDPITARLALEEFLPPEHFVTTGAAALILGSGGAGSALSHQLATRHDRPSKIICTALTDGRLSHLRELHQRSGVEPDLMRYVVTSSPVEADELLAGLPTASLVVNATGMGKDLPGSPLTNRARFPNQAVVWEFNYRGPLEFLQQARSQQAERHLIIEDGWRYLIHGWTQVIADVFDIPLPADTVARLSQVAAEVR